MSLPWKSQSEKEDYICKFLNDVWRRTELETAPDRQRMTLAYNLFQGKQSWADREDWQSTPFVHVLSKIVRRLADTLSGLIFEREDFFQIESKNPDHPGDVELARIFEKVVKYQLDEIGLPSLAYDYFIAGATAGVGVMKVTVEPKLVYRPEILIEEIRRDDEKELSAVKGVVADSETIPQDAKELERLLNDDIREFLGMEPESMREVSRRIGPKKQFEFNIRAELVDPRNFGWEPDASKIANSGYYIERFNKRFYELETLFETNQLSKKKRKEVLDLGHSPNNVPQYSISTYEHQKIQTRDQYPEHNKHAPVVELLEYFGPLIGPDGAVIEDNMHYITAGGKIVLKARRIEYWSQKAPYYFSVFSRSPFKAAGEGVADNAIDQQLLTNDLFATFMDMLKLAAYPPYVIDEMAIQNHEDMELGMFPAMKIYTYGKNAKEVFSQVQYDTNVANVLYQTLSRLEQQAFSGAGVDVTSANQASRARITASEINANRGRSDESVLALGRELDQNWLIPLIKAIKDITLQFGFSISTLEQFRLQGVLTESELNYVSDIPAIERFNEIQKNFTITVKGFRDRMERAALLRNVVEFLGILDKVPPALHQKIDWGKAMQDIVEAFGFEPNRWLHQNNPQDTAREENSLLGTNKNVDVVPEDPDPVHLPIHYEGLINNPNEAFAQHIMRHLRQIEQRGQPLPEIPDKVRDLLGLPRAAEMQQQPQRQGPPQQVNGAAR